MKRKKVVYRKPVSRRIQLHAENALLAASSATDLNARSTADTQSSQNYAINPWESQGGGFTMSW